jgi:hypothetical protein
MPLLVLTGSIDQPTTVGDVTIVGPKDVRGVLAGLKRGNALDP